MVIQETYLVHRVAAFGNRCSFLCRTPSLGGLYGLGPPLLQRHGNAGLPINLILRKKLTTNVIHPVAISDAISTVCK